ncbi:MAG: uridylate kinase [Candidatus Bathyarchaeota archaeon B63]|nr:MAG: uridylate kinase [Candidatus Bathyarchaeota archaeon B63]
MRIVLRIGGSVIASPPDPKMLNRYVEVITQILREGHGMIIVVGGGRPAREFIQIAKDMGMEEPEQDEVAISISRVFAQLISMKMGGHEWKDVPTSLEEARDALRRRGVAVMGGLRPGMTTDAVAALAASEIDADLIIKATDQDGVYTKDPEKHPEAEKIDEMSFEDLAALLERERHTAGIHQIIDPEAARILRERRIRTIVVNGFNPENVLAALRGEKVGTLIH